MIPKKAHNNNFAFRKRLRSFTFAFNGIKILWKEEHNFRIHLTATILVIIAGFLLQITRLEWIAVILSIGLVLATEIINTSLENLSDVVSPEKNEKIKKVKDLAAAGVLIATFVALITGLLIFIPAILNILYK